LPAYRTALPAYLQAISFWCNANAGQALPLRIRAGEAVEPAAAPDRAGMLVLRDIVLNSAALADCGVSFSSRDRLDASSSAAWCRKCVTCLLPRIYGNLDPFFWLNDPTDDYFDSLMQSINYPSACTLTGANAPSK
jgi:hypothetical protein